jgi:hypothetical protein
VLSPERRLQAVAAALVAAGLVVGGAGWYGAARRTEVAAQIPYLISGALLGLALLFLGSLAWFAERHAVALRGAQRRELDAERQHREVIDALRSASERAQGRVGPST